VIAMLPPPSMLLPEDLDAFDAEVGRRVTGLWPSGSPPPTALSPLARHVLDVLLGHAVASEADQHEPSEIWGRFVGILATRIFEAAPDCTMLVRAMENIPHRWHVVALDQLAERAQTDVARGAAWRAALARDAHVVTVRSSLESARQVREYAYLARDARAWRGAVDPFDGLFSHGAGLFHVALEPLQLLFRLDKRLWCESFDRLPGPAWFVDVSFFMGLSVREIVALLAVAPRVFTPDGRWTRSVAAVVMIERALSRVESEGQVRGPDEIAALASATLARDDGALLAVSFIPRAVRSAAHQGVERHRSVPEQFADRLTRTLPPERLSLRAVEHLWRTQAFARPFNSHIVRFERKAESPFGAATAGGAGLGVLLATARVLTTEPETTDSSLCAARESLWTLVVEALRARDSGVRSLEDDDLERSSLDWRPFADLLTQQTDPVARYRDAVATVDDQVERLSHWHAVDDSGIADAARFTVLLGATAAMHDPRADHEVKRTLYEEALRLAARLDHAQGYNPRSWRSFLIHVIGLAPSAVPDTPAEVVASWLRLVSDTPWDALSAASRMRDRGASETTLRAALALCGIDPSSEAPLVEEAAKFHFVPANRMQSIRSVLEAVSAVPPPTPSLESNHDATTSSRRLLVSSGRAHLFSLPPPAPLTRELGISQPLAWLRTDVPTTSADVRWARAQVQQRAHDLDAEVLLTPDFPEHKDASYGAIRCDAGANEDGIARAVRDALAQQDPFERRDIVSGFQHIGREDVVRHLASDIIRHRIVGLFGLRRVGKTSTALAAVRSLGDAVRPVYLDIQGIAQRDIVGVCGAILRALREQADSAWGAREDDSPGVDEALRDVARAFPAPDVRRQAPVCLVLDEFDLLFEGVLGGDGTLGIERLLEVLVAAVNRRAVLLCAIGRDPKRFQAARVASVEGGTALGRMSSRWLRPLSLAEAETLFERLGRRCGLHIGTDVVQRAYDWVGGHPLLLRLFGRSLREAAMDVPRATELFLSASDVRELVAGALFVVSQGFPDTWRTVGSSLREGRVPPHAPHAESMLAPLRWLGMVNEAGAIPDVYVKLGPMVTPVTHEAA